MLCWYSVVHGIDGLLPLVFGRSAHRFELAADRSRSGACGFRDHARDIAGALFGRGERFIEQAGEARQPLIEIGGAQVDGGHQRFKLRLAVGDRGRGGAVGLFDHAGGVDQRLAVVLELARQRAEILQRLRGLAVEDGELVFQRLRRDAVARGDVVHGGHEVGHAGHQRALQRVEVVVGAGQHFLQQDVAFTQPLEQRHRIGAQDLAGLLHFGDGRDRNLTRLVDGRTRRLFEVLQRLGYRAGGEVAGGRDRARDFRAVGRHRLRERLAAGLDRLQRVGGDAVDVGRELRGLGAERLDQRTAAAVDDLRQTIGLLLNIGDDFVGLAGHRRAEIAAGGEHRALDIGRGRLDLGC